MMMDRCRRAAAESDAGRTGGKHDSHVLGQTPKGKECQEKANTKQPAVELVLTTIRLCSALGACP